MLSRRLKLLRVLVALAMAAGLTAAMVDFRGAFPPRVGHWLASAQFVPSAVALATGASLALGAVIILAVTLAAGRVYCSAICPLGILQDVIARVASWLPGRKPPHRRYAPPMNRLRQIVLAVAVAGVIAGWVGWTLAAFDPYSNFGRIASEVFRPVLTLANNAIVGPANALGLTRLYRVEPHWAGAWVLHEPVLLLVLLIVLVVWRGRLYCNTLCPVGTLLGWVARVSAFRLELDKNACTKCAACLRICKAQCIELRTGAIDVSRCVSCYDCIGACDHGGIGHRFAWRRRPAPAAQLPDATPSGRNDAVESRAASPNPAVGANGAGSPPPPQGVEGQGDSAVPRRAFLAAAAVAATLGASGRLRAGPPLQPEPDADPDNHSFVLCPPGSGSIDQFLNRCTACQLCVSACPTHVLQPTWADYGLAGIMKPRMDYSTAFCNYECRICGEVCPSGAITLLALADKQLTQIGEAHFDEKKCIVAVKGTDCAACSEHCPTKAVFTTPYGDNLRLPKVNRDLCIGCGACEYACPVLPDKAIKVAGRRRHGRAQKPVAQKSATPAPAGDFPF